MRTFPNIQIMSHQRTIHCVVGSYTFSFQGLLGPARVPVVAAVQQSLERPCFVVVGVSLEGEILLVGSQQGSDGTAITSMGNHD